MRRPGLHARVTFAFAAGALAISAAMALLSYTLTAQTLLSGRERNSVRAAYFDATVAQAGLATDHPDVMEVLRTLDTGTSRRVAVRRDGEWYARSADSVARFIPKDLLDMVMAGQPAGQRVMTDAGPAYVVGVPLSPSTGFFVVDSLQQLDDTLGVLSLVLTLVAAGTTAAGAAVGWFTTRRALRPLGSVTRAAREIASGRLEARLDPTAEPDLAELTSSFNGMVDQLAVRLERDRRFAADVSHELRSPLQTLSAAASVLERRRAHLDERTATAVNLVSQELARFTDLVTDLLELARADQPVDLEQVDVAELARRTCEDRTLPAELVTVAPGTNTVRTADRRRLARVLANLLDNAERHGGGVVAVRLGGTAGSLLIDVEDEGPGVAPHDRTIIFDRFVRGRAAHARGDGDGTGLGLALAAQHVSAHGGWISVVDRPGGGARFRIELPGVG